MDKHRTQLIFLLLLTLMPLAFASIDLQLTNMPDRNFTDHVTTNICFTAKNAGDTNAVGVFVNVWHTSEMPANTLYLGQINFNAQQSRELCFDYKPLLDGTDILIAKIDPQNLIDESDKTNNMIQKMIIIAPNTDTNSGVAHALDFDIRGECSAFIGNGDRFYSQGIDTNGIDTNNPNAIYKIKFQLVDGLGNMIMQGSETSGYQLALTGRTLRIISVTKNVAKMMLIYPTAYTVSSNTCEVNVADLLVKYDNLMNDFSKLQSDLVEAKTQRQIYEDDSKTCKLNLDQSNASNITCVANISTVSTNLATCNDTCQKSKEKLQDQHVLDLNNLASTKDAVIKQQSDLAFEGWGLFFLVIIIAGFTMIMLKRTHILENKMN